ncbi:MAG: hypothetical protein WCV88_02935 [Patescibacteria group bacterium]|jgi:hypothetical protein
MNELLDQLLNEAHPGATLPPVLREKMIMDLTIQLEQRLFERLEPFLVEEQVIQLQQALTPPENTGKVAAILQTVPNYEEIMLQVYQQFREDYLNIK